MDFVKNFRTSQLISLQIQLFYLWLRLQDNFIMSRYKYVFSNIQLPISILVLALDATCLIWYRILICHTYIRMYSKLMPCQLLLCRWVCKNNIIIIISKQPHNRCVCFQILLLRLLYPIILAFQSSVNIYQQLHLCCIHTWKAS